MTKREELINMVAWKCVKASSESRVKSREDFRFFVEEFASSHNRLSTYLYEGCTRRSRKMFITKAHKKAKSILR